MVVKWFVGARRDFATTRRRITNARRMVHWLRENLQMPIVKHGVAAISRFRTTRIGQTQPASQRDNLIFEAAQLLFARLIKICATRGFERRVVGGNLLEEGGNI